MSRIPGHRANVPTAGTPPVSRWRDPTTQTSASTATSANSGCRVFSVAALMAERPTSANERTRSSVATCSATNPRSRAPRARSWRRSRSSMRRSRRTCRRARRIWRKRLRFHHQAPRAERTRPRRSVIVSRNASTKDAATPTGTTHSSVRADDSVSTVLMRLRAMAAASGAAPSPRSPAAWWCCTRASGATNTRAPASRARQHRSRSSAPGNREASKPPSSWNRSVRTSMAVSET